MSEFIVMHGIKVCKEFVPQTFGRLMTLGPKFRLTDGRCGQYTSFQVCECVCGNVSVMRSGNLKSGAQSCGCLNDEKNTKHGLR
jgi:hypothetical protein